MSAALEDDEARGRRRSIPVFPVLLVNFVGTLGYSIVLPFLVFLVTRLEGNALVYGLLGATYPAFQLVGAPLLGRWSDVYGRRRVLLLSQVGTLVSWIVFGVALFLPVTVLIERGSFVLTLPVLVLFASRALDGLTGGNVSVANAYLADITSEEERSANFGKMSIASNLGFVIGPALAGVLGATVYGELLPALAALAISLLGTILIARFLPEPDPCAADPGERGASVSRTFGLEIKDCIEREEAPLSLRGVLGLRDVPLLLVLYFLIFLGFNFFYTAFPLHAARSLGWSIPETGAFFGFLSLLMVVVQGPVLGALARRVSGPVLVIGGNAVLIVSFVLLSVGDTRVLYLAAALFALGNGVMWPSVLALLSRVAGERHQGAVQGTAGSVGSLASIVGLVGGGWLYATLGAGTFLLSAGTLAVVAVTSVRLIGVQRRLDAG